jgi:uncharacterized protein
LHFIWDEHKNALNRKNHGIDFETAQLVFSDSLALSRPDHYPYEERWQTVGLIGHVAILVIHTIIEKDSHMHEEVIRIISARKATKQERKAYEEGKF